MERLTFESDGYYAVSNEVCFDDQNEDYQGPAIDLLAAYEDTDKTPKDIALMQSVMEQDHIALKATESELAAYKDTGLTPTDIADLRNELCQRCGRYSCAHNGACDGCRWKKRE